MSTSVLPTDSTARDRLLVFARFPEPGQAKTRQIPALGMERAAKLQEALTRRTLHSARGLCAVHPCGVEVHYAGGNEKEMSSLYGPEFRYVRQQGEDLGNRLEQAMVGAFNEGAERLLIIGTDCPDLNASRLQEAFHSLKTADLVLGPAEDGGYYLIGLNRSHPEFFHGIDWGTEKVLQQTMSRARGLGVRVRLLPTLCDVDYPEDLVACRRYPSDFEHVLPSATPQRLSVIIPALNEELVIARALAALVGQENAEVIVADGGSSDGTRRIATELGATVVSARRGRGLQMNAGAALASGETLLFLHADSRLPANFRSAVQSVLDQPCIAGAFRLGIDSPRWSSRWIEHAANLRSQFLQMPYGDQALFLRADLFYEMGGFPNWPLMEDYELCRRLRRRGQIGLTQNSVCTSARRWAKLGVCRTTFVNQLTILGFHLGIPPDRLACWYSAWGRTGQA